MPRLPSPLFSDLSINLRLSTGSFLYEQNTGQHLLDLFGFFSSLPLGYNHKIFSSSEFISDVSDYLSLRASICAFSDPLILNFYQALVAATDSQDFTGLTLAETGALAVEQAIKLALLTHGEKTPICIIPNSYHGIYGVPASLTLTSGSALDRLSGQNIGSSYVRCLSNPDDLRQILKIHSKPILILEPIRCTAGDFAIEDPWFQLIRELQDANQLCLITDEVQTGIFSTGAPWAHQNFGLKPDIIVFGKKAQVCGTLSKPEYATFIGGNNPKYFSSTYDASPIDLIRAIHLLSYIQSNKDRIIDSITDVSSRAAYIFGKAFREADIRAHGCLIATTLSSEHKRNYLVKELLKRRILCNPTGATHVRFRLPLNFSENDLAFLEKAIYENTFE